MAQQPSIDNVEPHVKRREAQRWLVDLDASHTKRRELFGVSNKLATPALRAATANSLKRDLLPAIAAGCITPAIDRVFAFAELPAAKDHMKSDAQFGRIVVTVA